MTINNAEEELRSQQLKHEFEIEVEKRAKKNLQREKDTLENELNISKQEVMALKSTVAKMTADSLGITTELQATKVGLNSGCLYFNKVGLSYVHSIQALSIFASLRYSAIITITTGAVKMRSGKKSSTRRGTFGNDTVIPSGMVSLLVKLSP